MNKIDINSLECNTFTKHLLLKAPRFYCYNMLDKDDAPFYVPMKDKILFPCKFAYIESHDIAHMIEMNNLNRTLIPDWGFKNWSWRVPNGKKFFVGLSREIRVRAITILLENIPRNKDSSSWNILNNPVWGPEAEAHLPFGKFKTLADIQRWADYLRDTTLAHWNKDRIEAEWMKKIEFISNWMETSQAA